MTNTTHIYNLDELQDRRIMMDKKLPPYGYALIILTGFLMVYLLLWSTKNYRTYVSQSTGTVQAANKTYIMSSYSGAITELNVSEGSYVNEGDLIAHIKSTDLDMQTGELREPAGALSESRRAQYEKLVKSIQDDKNYFSETDLDDQPYYYQYESYKSQVAAEGTFDAAALPGGGLLGRADQGPDGAEPERPSRTLYYSTLQSIICQPDLHPEQYRLHPVPAGCPEHGRERLLHLCPHLRRHPHGHPL